MPKKIKQIKTITARPWGKFYDWDGGKEWHLKTIVIKKGARLSLQSHKDRSEIWIVVEGKVRATVERGGCLVTATLSPGETLNIPARKKHRLASKTGATLVEVAFGKFNENDIKRFKDDYGRVEN